MTATASTWSSSSAIRWACGAGSFRRALRRATEESDPIELANRELREETGLRAASMELLGTLDVAPGMSSQRGRVFLATGITEGEHDREHEEQDMHSDWFSRAQLERMIRDGDICDAQTVAAWALLLLAGH